MKVKNLNDGILLVEKLIEAFRAREDLATERYEKFQDLADARDSFDSDDPKDVRIVKLHEKAKRLADSLAWRRELAEEARDKLEEAFVIARDLQNEGPRRRYLKTLLTVSI